ncbi:MAG: HAMP domain-containing sensor histidine kinase [Rubrivivax sp.]|nr:HAMP domain-containing sensor histidine kinase [Rubrivivax sp.]
MRSLYLRIYATVVAALALFALVAGVLMQHQLGEQRALAESAARERVEAWAELLQRALPPADATPAEQQEALREWAQRLRVPMALDDASGERIAATESFLRRNLDRPGMEPRLRSIRLDDGRTLWVSRFGALRGPPGAPRPAPSPPWPQPPGWPDGFGLVALLGGLFLAVAGGVWPVVRRLTRRLEALKRGVESFGAGALHQRVAEDGRDEVAALGASFNRAAGRIEALLRSHQSLLANASHELRSPLARLKMALAMIEEAPAAQRAELRKEIDTDIAELDALVEEVLLTSRLDATAALDVREPVALLAVLAEESSRVGARASGDDVQALGDERLLRRAVRNLLENARRYGGADVEASAARLPGPGRRVELRVCDRGPGVPEAFRERIFEAFFRLPGHAEREGGVGLGLSLVRQIAERHGGGVRCEPRAGGGTCFVLELPAA